MTGSPEPREHGPRVPKIRPGGQGRSRARVSWSTGKDSAYALRLAQAERRTEVLGLFTTVDEDAGTVACNGVPVSLAQAQAAALGLPLHLLSVPEACSPRDREALRRAVLAREAVPEGVTAMIFGDAGGPDIRDSRAARLAGPGIAAAFPLRGIDTRRLCLDILAAGIRAVITRLDPSVADAGWAGSLFGTSFIGSLGAGADPCGENGESRTFACCAPGFGYAIPVALERVTRRDGSVYAEIAAARSPAGEAVRAGVRARSPRCCRGGCPALRSGSRRPGCARDATAPGPA
jgi:diphthamide synthase (EF-2-diphthine--ammonia ligase)